jgi:hypothetical protein
MRIVTAGHVQQLIPQPSTEHVIKTKPKPRVVEEISRSERYKEKNGRVPTTHRQKERQ